MIELQNVSKLYHEGRENEVRALSGVDLKIGLDGVSVFKGPSGSGKTTLLTLIGGLSKPTSGRIHLDGELISNLPEKFLTGLRRRYFGFIFQRFNLIRGLSVAENIMLPAYPLGPNHAFLKERAHKLADKLNIGAKIDMKVEVLSGGEAQRVAIARALVNDPKVIIADEPTANLDTKLSKQFLQIIEQLRLEGKSIIMTSHDPRIWRANIVTRVISMEDGRIVDDGAEDGEAPRETGEEARR